MNELQSNNADLPEEAGSAVKNVTADEARQFFQMALDSVDELLGPGPWKLPSEDDLPGLFPGFQVEAFIGRGGMGAVYNARDLKLGRFVAIKLLPRRLAAQAGFEERFKREAETLARCQHPGIVTIHSDGSTEAGHLFFVMEYLDGTSLREVMRSGQLEVSQTLRIVAQVCDALDHAHGLGIVHRDVSPSNIFLMPDGRVKVVDFGLARGTEKHDLALTSSDVAMGNPDYMPPEQKHGEATAASDIYALGKLLYEILTGELPHGAFELPSRKARVAEAVDRIVLTAMQSDPSKRYQTASAMKVDIHRASEPAPVKSIAWRVAAAVVALAALPIIGFLAIKKRGQNEERVESPPKQEPAAIAMRADAGGPDVSAVLNEARNLYSAQQFKKAVEKYREALAQSGEGVEEKLETLNIRKLLCYALRENSEYGETVRELEQTLKIRERIQGPKHADTLANGFDLAVALWYNGDFDRAIAEHRRVLALREKELPAGSIDIALSLDSLARVLMRVETPETWREGREKLRNAIDLYQKASGGSKHSEIAEEFLRGAELQFPLPR